MTSKQEFKAQINSCTDFFRDQIRQFNYPVRVYTHYDADGLCSGAILAKALFREKIPYHLSVLKQLDKSIIYNIASTNEKSNNFTMFSDFGSGQCYEIEKKLTPGQYVILDHHLPESIENKDMKEEIRKLKEDSSQFQINPYFAEIDGSIEISGAGVCYLFSKALNPKNEDLSPLAVIAAVGDMQNQGPNGSFIGINSDILDEAIKLNKVEIKTDLNFSSIKPLNEAIAFSSDIQLPGLQRKDVSLKFLQKIGVLVEKADGDLKTLSDFNWEEKQKISSAIVKYAIDSCGLDPTEITKILIVNKYLLLNDVNYPELSEAGEFAHMLNSCGRTNNESLGLSIAMGDRNKSMVKAKEVLREYKKKLEDSIKWVLDNHKLKRIELIQYFYGEDVIPEEIIGIISSMLVNSQLIDKTKPIFGYADKKGEDSYKVSGRTTMDLVHSGVNLAEVIKIALKLTKLGELGGGHPPAAGTKVKKSLIEEFLVNCNKVIKKQLSWKL